MHVALFFLRFVMSCVDSISWDWLDGSAFAPWGRECDCVIGKRRESDWCDLIAAQCLPDQPGGIRDCFLLFGWRHTYQNSSRELETVASAG